MNGWRSERAERQANYQNYLTRIAGVLNGGDFSVHYSQVFTWWEFIFDKRFVNIGEAKCQICGNRMLKTLFKITPVARYRHRIPINSPLHYWVGSICVENFFHEDEKGNKVAPQKKGQKIKKLKKTIQQDMYKVVVLQRITEEIQRFVEKFPRLKAIYKRIKFCLANEKSYTFQTMSDAIVYAVTLGIFRIDILQKCSFRVKDRKKISFQELVDMEHEEVIYYNTCIEKYNTKSSESQSGIQEVMSYQISDDEDENDGIIARNPQIIQHS